MATDVTGLVDADKGLLSRRIFIEQDIYELELHVLDETRNPQKGRWVPAGENLGESMPTGFVGDSGYVVYEDGTIDYWAVRDAAGVFAVGQTAQQIVGGGPRLCGVGMIPFVVFATFLFVLRLMRRGFCNATY